MRAMWYGRSLAGPHGPQYSMEGYTVTSAQKARVFRLFCNGAIVMSCSAHEDIDRFNGPGEAHRDVERAIMKRLTNLALRLGLTLKEWNKEMDHAAYRESIMRDGDMAESYHAWQYGYDAVEIADQVRNDPDKQLKARLEKYKRLKRDIYGDLAPFIVLNEQ